MTVRCIILPPECICTTTRIPVLLTYTLKEGTHKEIIPVCTKIHTAAVACLIVSDHYLISMRIKCVVAIVDHSIIIDIFELDVAWPPYSCGGRTEQALIC